MDLQPQSLLAGYAAAPQTATASTALPQVSQASMVAALQGYPASALGAAGLAGAYQTATIPTSASNQLNAVSPNRAFQNAAVAAAAANAAAASTAGQETALGQQAKKRQREEDLMLVDAYTIILKALTHT